MGISGPEERTGDVLGPHAILKNDEFASGINLAHAQDSGAILLSGTANFRRSRSNLNVYGAAQPTEFGVRSVCNHILGGARDSSKKNHVMLWVNLRAEPLVYINHRAFVLRDQRQPFTNFAQYRGIPVEKLEDMEKRLKSDILVEAEESGGNVLIHTELADRLVVPMWEAVGDDRVHTGRELFESIAADVGGVLKYARVPVSADTVPRPEFFDQIQALLSSLLDSSTDSVFHVVFNCQMGRGRSTLGMATALLVLQSPLFAHRVPKTLEVSSAIPSEVEDEGHLEGQSRRQDTYGLDELRNGEYMVVMNLLRVLTDGIQIKHDVDQVINQCDALVNLRTRIFKGKHQSTTARDPADAAAYLQNAANSLDKYFRLIAFRGFLEGSSVGDGKTFSEWFAERRELMSLIDTIQSSPSSALSGRSAGTVSWLTPLNFKRHGAVLSSDMILKADVVRAKYVPVPGAPNFRVASLAPVAGTATPTIEGLRNLFNHLGETSRLTSRLMWINLREEPLVYINGQPFAIRRKAAPFQNLDMYSGISDAGVEKMEDNLKQDILKEIAAHPSGQVLLHGEGESSSVFYYFESVAPEDVLTPREVMEGIMKTVGVNVTYHRVPVTATRPPEKEDFDKLVSILESAFAGDKQSLVLFSDQLGRGRSTTAMVIASQFYLHRHSSATITDPSSPVKARKGGRITMLEAASLVRNISRVRTMHVDEDRESVMDPAATATGAQSGQRAASTLFPSVVALVRVVRNAFIHKSSLDQSVEDCSAIIDLRDSIHHHIEVAANARTDKEREVSFERACRYLERYLLLFLFEVYLVEGTHTADQTFTAWLETRPEIKLILSELSERPKNALDIVKHDDAERLVSGSHIDAVIAGRKREILGPNHILKSDHFPGCQRTNLSVSIPGAPNYRKLPDVNIHGVAIPTFQGIEGVLNQLGAADAGTNVVWVNLREEPVVYVNGRPYVLRPLSRPFSNIEHTGINGARVEDMETRLKGDCLAEAREHDSKVLLHDESDEGDVLAEWADIPSGDTETVLTPRECYNLMAAKGYNVTYHRIPITDESAPKYSDFDLILDLLKQTPISENTHFIFNCQMGRGRTTTGIVIAVMYHAHRVHSSPLSTILSSMTPRRHEQSDEDLDDKGMALAAAHLRGEYHSVLHLVRLLQDGASAKTAADVVLDYCEAMQNLREAIADFRQKVETALSEKQRNAAQHRGTRYLQRYFMLIAFQGFLSAHEAGLDKLDDKFSAFMESETNLQSLMTNISIATE